MQKKRMNRIDGPDLEEFASWLQTPIMVEKIAASLGLDSSKVKELLGELCEPLCETKPRSDLDGDSYVLYTDGASRNNPGPAAGGAVLYTPTGEKVDETCEFFSSSLTNNASEYRALLLGLALIPEECSKLKIRMDSELIIRQLQGEYAVKSARLRPYYEQVCKRLEDFDRVSFEAIPREENSEADALANLALDRR